MDCDLAVFSNDPVRPKTGLLFEDMMSCEILRVRDEAALIGILLSPSGEMLIHRTAILCRLALILPVGLEENVSLAVRSALLSSGSDKGILGKCEVPGLQRTKGDKFSVSSCCSQKSSITDIGRLGTCREVPGRARL